jgi:hypothetical protein
MDVSLRTAMYRPAQAGQGVFLEILQRRILHLSTTLAVLLAVVICCSTPLPAQEERPQIMPSERRAPKKKDSGPRALAVLQLAQNGKASLVPVAILINGKFWDASAYKADPVPMALDSGNVYEAERAGSSLGLFTVGSALHSNNPNMPNPWIGTGAWRPVGSEPATKEAKADPTPLGIDQDQAPPRLTRDANSTRPSQPASTSSETGKSTAPANPPGKSSGSSSGDEPPRLSKPASSAPPAEKTSQPSNPAAAGSAPSSNDSKAADSKKKESGATIPASDSGADSGDRPVLRRGKPAESFADEDVPGYSRPGATRDKTPGKDAKGIETASASTDVELIPAISDASGPPPHSFHFEWLKGEEGDRRKQMMDTARSQLRKYVAERMKARVIPPPVHSRPAQQVLHAQEPIFDNVQMVAYDLWNSNQPIMVFSATAHMPPPAVGSPHSEVESDLQYSVLLVAYPDIYNNLHQLYSGVTDKFHLDVTPRLDLIDAVDADGDGRGELLFRETSDAGTGWVVYRATADKLWKMFDSLNPE